MPQHIPPVDGSALSIVLRYSLGNIGGITCNMPIHPTGEEDLGRPPIWTGETIITFSNGNARPIQFPIKAADLAGAILGWNSALASALDELRSMQTREQLLNGSAVDLSKMRKN